MVANTGRLSTSSHRVFSKDGACCLKLEVEAVGEEVEGEEEA